MEKKWIDLVRENMKDSIVRQRASAFDTARRIIDHTAAAGNSHADINSFNLPYPRYLGEIREYLVSEGFKVKGSRVSW